MKSTKEQGITLIALIITIIVLVILAGVALNTLLGNNGILDNSQYATSEYKKSAEKEAVALAFSNLKVKLYTDDGITEITAELLEQQLNEAGNNVEVEEGENGTFVVTFKNTGNQYEVTAGGRILGEDKTEVADVEDEEVLDGEVPEEPFEYNTAGAYSLIIPVSGNYKIECWGAQGGASYSSSYHGGYGGYSTGTVYLQKGKEIWIYVGGQGSGNGTHTKQVGGFNGGGDANTDNDGNTRQSSGGGATHIAIGDTDRGELKNYKQDDTIYWDEILIVAGGGGGAGANSALSYSWKNGGSGGGIIR